MKKTKLIFILMIAVIAMTVMPMAGYAMTGSGTQADPYVITSEADLKAVSNDLSANYKLGTNIALTSSWTPVGSILEPFEGSFDGDGYTISGLNVTVSVTEAVAGLFACNNGEIKNLTVEMGTGINVTATESAYVGGIAGINIGGKITNCHVEGNITVSASTKLNTSNVYVGMVAGKSTGAVTSTNARGSITANVAAVSGTRTSSDPVQIFAGGLIGLSTANQENNFAVVDIQATATSPTEYSAPVIKAGGLTGENSGKIEKSYAAGNVTATAASSALEASVYAGGLIGQSSGTVKYTNATGNVTAETNSSAAKTYAGGLIGFSTADVSESFATGIVTSEADTANDTVYAGGLIGLSNGRISKCYAVGQATATGAATNAVNGGLVGFTLVSATDSYYENASGYTQLAGCGVAKTEAELKTAATFSGWDFADTWKISAGQNSGYPYLKALSSVEVVFTDAEYVYDGTEKVLTATTISGETVSVEYENNRATDAGVYNAVAIVTATDYNKTVVTAKLTIHKKEIAIAGIKANDKDFDNTTAATVDVSGATLEGVVEGDDVSIDASNTKAYFASKNVGENITVTITDIKLTGADANNYFCNSITTTANIFDGDYSDVVLEGAGTISDPYLISDEGELNAIRGNLGANYKLTDDILITSEWIPIGRIGRAFTGSLDGDGYTISGLRVSADTNYTYSGLFGYSEGNISNLKIDVAGDLYTTANNSYIGAVAGMNAGTITNCSIGGNITTNPNSAFVYVGGIVGMNVGTITYSDSTAAINAYGSTVYAGGVVGENSGIVENTGATGDVTVNGALFAYAGGFAGNNMMTVRNSYATGDVTVNVINTGFMANVGGFAGRLEGGAVSTSYSAGKPDVVVATGAYLLQSEKGGFTAYNVAMVTDCYYDSSVAGLTDSLIATPKTTAEMQTMSTYSGWSTDLWRISSQRNGGYPYIKKYYTLSQNATLSYNVAANTITVEAYTDIETACLIAVSYNGGAMVDFDIITPVELAEGEISEKAVKADFDVREGGSVKVMLWENMITIRPLCTAKEIAIR